MVGGRLTRLHLWLGELLGITRYENCWNCKHAEVWGQHADGSHVKGIVACSAYKEEDGIIAITGPCEAVWCGLFEERGE